MNLADEKNLVILSLIFGVFILVTLSSTIGTIYFAMAVVYAIAMQQKQVISFAKERSNYSKIIPMALFVIILFFGVSALFLGSFETVQKSVSFFASSFLTNFTIDNALIKIIVFGFFIPIVETLFFYGVIYKFLLSKVRTDGNVRKQGTWVAILMLAGIATSFHFYVRLLNNQALITDLVFFGISAVIVSQQKELSAAATAHIIINTYVMATVVGVLI